MQTNELITDYPKQVSIETATTCNAHCDFCPHHELARVGHVMEMGLVEKIIRELAEFPQSHPLEIATNGVNEPLADKRTLDILSLISGSLPWAKIYFVTNGNLLTEKAVAELARHNLSKLNISLNFCERETYERRMGLRWDKTTAALDMLHEKVQAAEFPYPVHVSRVEDGSEQDASFARFVRSRYPAFQCWLKSSGDWLGAVSNVSHKPRGAKGKCGQWYMLHIASTGIVQYCCMDGDCQFPRGYAKTMNLLDIYNQPDWLDLRHGDTTRFDVYPCNRCTYML